MSTVGLTLFSCHKCECLLLDCSCIPLLQPYIPNSLTTLDVRTRVTKLILSVCLCCQKKKQVSRSRQACVVISKVTSERTWRCSTQHASCRNWCRDVEVELVRSAIRHYSHLCSNTGDDELHVPWESRKREWVERAIVWVGGWNNVVVKNELILVVWLSEAI